jgi:hypothetical protein
MGAPMNFKDLPAGLTQDGLRWALILRELAQATGEKSSRALARRLNVAPGTLCRYLQGHAPKAAFATIGARLIDMADTRRCQRAWTAEDLKSISSQADPGGSGDMPGSPSDDGRPEPEQSNAESKPAPAGEAQGAAADHPGRPAQANPTGSGANQQEVSKRSDESKPTGGPAIARHRNRKIAAVAAVFTLLGGGIAYLLWGQSGTGQEQAKSAASDDRTSYSTHIGKCALVTAASSPVWVDLNDRDPLKWKIKNDRVQLIDIPLRTTQKGTLQAVAVPKGSPTGQGWMLDSDLTLTSCDGLP